MKIGLISDVHSRQRVVWPEIPPEVDLMVLAGDMGDPYKVRGIAKSWGVPFIYLAGNHEAYKLDFNTVMSEVFNNTDGCYNNYSIDFMGKRIHACTLWTDLKTPIDEINYNTGLNDSRYISNWSATDVKREFELSKMFLMDNVQEGDIVVTHHAPSWQSVHESYKGDALNSCFVSDLDDFILQSKPSLWMHGHVHNSFDYTIGNTRVVCNPHAYNYERSKMGSYHVKVIEA